MTQTAKGATTSQSNKAKNAANASETQQTHSKSSPVNIRSKDTQIDAKPSTTKNAVKRPHLGPYGIDLNNGMSSGKNRIDRSEKEAFEILENEPKYEVLNDQLRDSYIIYQESASRCKTYLRQGNDGDQFKKYYFPPKTPFLMDPEKQKAFRKELISDIGRLPEPESLTLMADSLQLDSMETLWDRSAPKATKEELAKFYLRRTAQLQHKKYKLMGRWANSQLSAENLDDVSGVIDRAIGFIQQELDSCHSRLERLVPDDNFEGAETAKRPSPVTKVKHQVSDARQNDGNASSAAPGETHSNRAMYAGMEKEEQTNLYLQSEHQSVNSSIRLDDFEVFLRIKTYRTRLMRQAHKLVNHVKWLPYTHRFDMWRESRVRMFNMRKRQIQERQNMYIEVAQDIKNKLQRLGISEEKAVHAVTERYTFHLKDTEFKSRLDQLQNSYKTDRRKPHFLFATNIELKFKLDDLSQDYPSQLSTNQIDLDMGQQFSYQLQTLFPIEFEKLVVSSQFDPEDSGHTADRQHIERLVRNLGLSRVQILQEMSKYAEQLRRNSILGALNFDMAAQKAEDDAFENSQRSQKGDKDQGLSQEEFQKHNLLKKIRSIQFFSLNENPTKLRRADWLEYVCFEAFVPEVSQRQNQILSGSENHIDSLLKAAFDCTDINDQASINKILDDASQGHIKKILDIQGKITEGQDLDTHVLGTEAQTVGLQKSLVAATNPQAIANKKLTAGQENKAASMKKYSDINNVDQLNLSLVKCYYSLRYLKIRNCKKKLLSVVNYFRAVQRILALDLKQFVTREKGIGDEKDLIQPQFGRDGEGKQMSKKAAQSGPGQIFQTHIKRKLDQEEVPLQSDPVTLKAYKYGGLFRQHTTSTCPLVPKYHRTFGRPNLYESVQEEMDRGIQQFGSLKGELGSLLIKRDRILVNQAGKEVTILNEFGQKIVYEEALNDMVELEEEMIKVGSYYVNRYEYAVIDNDIAKANSKHKNTTSASKDSTAAANDTNLSDTRPGSLVDRAEISRDLFEKELEFQFEKVRLIEKMLEAYENIYDPLESVRTLQQIVDLMAARPRLNFDSFSYTESYDTEIEVLKQKRMLIEDLIDYQREQENELNKEHSQFQELKVKRVRECLTEVWKMEDPPEKKQVQGSNEDNENVVVQEDQTNEKLRAKIARHNLKQHAMKEIEKSHITEFANAQLQNFSDVLGIPEVSLEEIAGKRDQKDPIVQDSIRESAFFAKQIEGYPQVFSVDKHKGTILGLHGSNEFGITDFYESLWCLPKVMASIVQACECFQQQMNPESNLAVSSLEVILIERARMMIRQLKNSTIGSKAGEQKIDRGEIALEEDFFFSYSDKLVFAMKELHADLEETHLYTTANPIVVSKLDINSVEAYNFPRISQEDVIKSYGKGFGELSGENANDLILKRMIELAKTSVARPTMTAQMHLETDSDENNNGDVKRTKEKKEKLEVKSPSMMKMCCNMIEVLRLREQLIERVNETNILGKVYLDQCKAAGKQNTLLVDPKNLNFSTGSLLKEHVNIVDNNDGRNIPFELPFVEFDPCLSANFDLKSESCIKALMLDSGVEDLRAILHYQVMQQQLLTIAVMHNTLVMDGAQRGLSEIQLLEENNIAVPNSIVDVAQILSDITDGKNLQQLRKEKEIMRHSIGLNSAMCMYWITPKKQRETLGKECEAEFKKQLQKFQNDKKMSPELILRILRSVRVKLLRSYCLEVQKGIYPDTIKIQLLQTAQEMRQRACLLPSENKSLFEIGTKGDLIENLSAEARQFLNQDRINLGHVAKTRIIDVLKGQVDPEKTIFFVPSSHEIATFDRAQQALETLESSEQTISGESRGKKKEEADSVFEMHELKMIDANIKTLSKKPTMLIPTFSEYILPNSDAANQRTVSPTNGVIEAVHQHLALQKDEKVDEHQMYRVEGKQKYALRKVYFKEAYAYGHKESFNLLCYISLILKIFNLEYFMGRNSCPGLLVNELESQVNCGLEFWNKITKKRQQMDTDFLRFGDNSQQVKRDLMLKKSATERVIDRILQRKRDWVELHEHMSSIKTRIFKINDFVQGMQGEHRTFKHTLDVLILMHHSLYFRFLNGLESIVEIFRDKHEDEYFHKVLQVRDNLTQQNRGIYINLKNGFFVSQASHTASRMPIQASDYQDFEAFSQQYNPMVDERSMIPAEFRLMGQVFGSSSNVDSLSRDPLLFFTPKQTHYSCLQNAFLNMDDRARSYIGNNFPQLDDLIEQYLVYKGLMDADMTARAKKIQKYRDAQVNSPSGDQQNIQFVEKKSNLRRATSNFEIEKLLATVELMSYKIEASHMQRLLICFMNGAARLPAQTQDVITLIRKYQDVTTLEILQEKEHLNNLYFMGESGAQRRIEAAKKEGEQNGDQLEKDMVLGDNKSTRRPKDARFNFFDRINLLRAETNVVKKLIDQKMVRYAVGVLQNEHSALHSAFEQAGSEEFVQAYVHPQQQFASTMFQSVDRNSHLDVISKLGFMQQFLTRLRNRCTEVETLTSGPGIVFSLKDFNDCLSIFCKQLLKYGEEQMRSRCETQALMSNQYRHLIYLKDMEIVYFRSKCEQFLKNIDVIVNAKMSHKGNEMIYELDVTSRELRSLKDHYFLMEKYLREEITHEFQRDMQEKDNKIKSLSDNFNNFRSEMQTDLQKQCANEIMALDEVAKKRQRAGLGFLGVPGISSAAVESDSRKIEEAPENYQTILDLQQYIRKMKVLTMMKNVLREEKSQRELNETKQKLSMNASLWEQLAETQKREQITRQELELTKQNLTHYEKLIEKLYVQLEYLNNQKIRLQQFKKSKSKRIDELESKMKELEILENIDLNKILLELKQRDKKLGYLQDVDTKFNDRLKAVDKANDQELSNLQKKLAAERDAKLDAFAKLESMRVEMKALEGHDIKNDLWKDKCKELYEISKELEGENENLRQVVKESQMALNQTQATNQQLMLQQTQTNLLANRQQSHEKSSFNPDMMTATMNSQRQQPRKNVRENLILQRHNFSKPQTANQAMRRAQSGAPGARGRIGLRNYQAAQSMNQERIAFTSGQTSNQHIGFNGGGIDEATILTNTSFPAFSAEFERQNVDQKSTGRQPNNNHKQQQGIPSRVNMTLRGSQRVQTASNFGPMVKTNGSKSTKQVTQVYPSGQQSTVLSGNFLPSMIQGGQPQMPNQQMMTMVGNQAPILRGQQQGVNQSRPNTTGRYAARSGATSNNNTYGHHMNNTEQQTLAAMNSGVGPTTFADSSDVGGGGAGLGQSELKYEGFSAPQMKTLLDQNSASAGIQNGIDPMGSHHQGLTK